MNSDQMRAIARSVATGASDSPSPAEYVAAGYKAGRAELDELRAENSELTGLIAECRECMPLPPVNTELEQAFACAVGQPSEVPAFVRMTVDALRADAQDAARYRHLVATCNIDFDPSEPWQLVIWEPSTGEDWKEKLDAAIDAAMPTEAEASAWAKEAERLYSKWTDDQGIHCNRFPSWRELSLNEHSKWIDKARAAMTAEGKAS